MVPFVQTFQAKFCTHFPCVLRDLPISCSLISSFLYLAKFLYHLSFVIFPPFQSVFSFSPLLFHYQFSECAALQDCSLQPCTVSCCHIWCFHPRGFQPRTVSASDGHLQYSVLCAYYQDTVSVQLFAVCVPCLVSSCLYNTVQARSNTTEDLTCSRCDF